MDGYIYCGKSLWSKVEPFRLLTLIKAKPHNYPFAFLFCQIAIKDNTLKAFRCPKRCVPFKGSLKILCLW